MNNISASELQTLQSFEQTFEEVCKYTFWAFKISDSTEPADRKLLKHLLAAIELLEPESETIVKIRKFLYSECTHSFHGYSNDVV